MHSNDSGVSSEVKSNSNEEGENSDHILDWINGHFQPGNEY